MFWKRFPGLGSVPFGNFRGEGLEPLSNVEEGDALRSGAPRWNVGEGKRTRTQGCCPSRETNMKVRQAIPVTSELGDISRLAKFDGE